VRRVRGLSFKAGRRATVRRDSITATRMGIRVGIRVDIHTVGIIRVVTIKVDIHRATTKGAANTAEAVGRRDNTASADMAGATAAARVAIKAHRADSWIAGSAGRRSVARAVWECRGWVAADTCRA